MKYEDPTRISEDEAVKVFLLGSAVDTAKTLIALALHGKNQAFTQSWCLFFLGGGDETEVSAAAISLGHIARITGSIDKDVVVPALIIAKTRHRHRVEGIVEDALGDIEVFCPE